MNRLLCRESWDDRGQHVADPELLGVGDRRLHQRVADAAPAEAGSTNGARACTAGSRLSGLRVDTLQQDRAGRLAVVLRDHQPLLGGLLAALDDQLEVGDLVLPVGPAEAVLPEVGEEDRVVEGRLAERDRRPAHRLSPLCGSDELAGLTLRSPSPRRHDMSGVVVSLVPGLATLVNVATVLVGAVIGVALGNRLPTRTRDVVTDALGLVTLLIAGTVGDGGPVRRSCATRSATARPC